MRKLLLLVIPLSTMLASFNIVANVEKISEDLNHKAEVEQVFHSYMKKYNHFINHQELKKSPVLYAEQVMLITNSSKPATLTPAIMNKGVTDFLTALKAKGVKRVAWEKVDIQLLASNIALASNVAVRYLANGEVYDRAGATYFLNKSPKGWEISAFALHAPENVVNFLPKG